MTSHILVSRYRARRTLGLGLGVCLAVLANLGDRAFSASPASGGIDPLEILNTAAKNNILFIVDTSSSMAGTPEDQGRIVGGDDPASRFYQTKRAVREVITTNAGKANFGLATFHPEFVEHQMDGSQGLVYVTQDPSASVWRSYFNAVSGTFTSYDTDTCTGVAGACSATEKTEIFVGLDSNSSASTSAYPSGCTAQTTNQVANGGVANAPITHTYGTHCRDYIKSRLMRNGKRYRVTPSLSSGSTRTNGALVSSTDITCPNPPPGLLGDDALPFANGSQARACFQIENATTLAITTYWVTGANFDFVNVNGPSGSCDQSGVNVDVADCGVDNSEEINSYMRMELQYNGTAGAPRDVPSLTNLSSRKPNLSEVPPFSLDVTPPISTPFQNPGIRQGNGTPLASSMTFALNYFRNTVLPAAGTAKRPVAAQGKQKQFVILLSDGDESCGGNAPNAGYALWTNTLPALPACDAACLSAKGVTAEEWSVANRIELITITFAGGSAGNVDTISRAGTGRNPANSTCQPLYPGFAGSPLAPCRTAFIANNLNDLVNALNAAINTSVATGEFSDQQSVTESVFEFGAYGVPAVDPFDPSERYGANIPILLQSTFELPGYKGHLNAFRRAADGTSTEMWDGGAKLNARVQNALLGMGAQPASTCTVPGTGCYTFAQLYGNAANTDPLVVAGTTAKIKRRIFTTSQNGVNASYTPTNLLANASALAGSRVPLWPPSTAVAPTVTATSGVLDSAMGFEGLTVAQLQALVPGACQGTVAADIHPDCTSATAGVALARTKREAREITLAYLAGAQLQAANGVPLRASSGGSADELLYIVRPWIMSESTLAAPGVVTPPLLAGPKSGGLGYEEYKHYRDGIKQANGAPFASTPSQVVRGVGLRNPDRLADDASQSVKDAAFANLELKPSMSVVYHATNQGLHALRGGPCPVPDSSSGLGATSVDCQNTLDGTPRESGGEELWAFVPFDQLAKLPALTKIQTRDNKQYLLAAPVRFTDVFVPGNASYGGVAFTGVWRTLLYFGRGQGGKYMTALDVTAPGPFTRLSVKSEPPIVVWSRGNPDTNNGRTTAAGGLVNNSASDYAAYLKMGETWSVPSVGYVTAADYVTTRKPFGTDFVLFSGSGYSDTAGEGKTFYVIDALTGDIVRNFDIADGTPAAPPVAVPPAPQDPPLTNFLVAPTVYYAEDPVTLETPASFYFVGNPITIKTKTVYFGDLHSRIWRYNAITPATAPAVFFEAPAAEKNQPFATAVTVIADPTVAGDVLVYAEAGHDRRVTPQAAKPFKAYAWRDTNGVRGDVFTQNFPTGYRGTVQPAGGFLDAQTPVIFYAGVRFTGSCVSHFDSILYGLRGLTASGTPVPAFDLDGATGDDPFVEIATSKINAIRISGEGSLVVDQGLNAQNAPPAPGPAVPSEVVSSSSSLVTMGLVPNTKPYRELSATTVPYRIGSSVCRVQ